MLLFIKDAHNRATRKYEFQYISCYSLSVCPAKAHRNHSRFNTSHVTLYRTGCTGDRLGFFVSIHLMLLFIVSIPESITICWWFQYISCYSLSVNVMKYSHLLDRFQYISCYSLSSIPILL